MCPKLSEKFAKNIVLNTIKENRGEMPHSKLREQSIQKYLKKHTLCANEDHLDRARFLVSVAICDLKAEKIIKRETIRMNWKINKNIG
jgi:hypothetical protein